ncbi:MAG: PLP-dependent transferase [Acidimicrobiales bacterium]
MQTRAVAAGRPDGPGAPLNEPLVAASNFLLDGARAYARDDGTPTWAAFEAVVGALEGAEAVAFGSGMAAIAAVFDLLPVGAHIVWPDDCYQGVAGLIAQGVRLGRWRATRLAVQDTDAWCAAAASADLLWVESPSNPLLTVADLHRIAAAPRPAGSILAVDNTLAGPAAQQPLELGADVSVQSATKHLGGHSDRCAGWPPPAGRNWRSSFATTGSCTVPPPAHWRRTWPPGACAPTRCGRPHRRPRPSSWPTAWPVTTGSSSCATPGWPRTRPTTWPAASWRTTAASSPSTWSVGGSGRCGVRPGGPVRHATSFGAVESTIERRAAVPGQEHLPPGLLRLSVGIEHVEDLWADLDEALGGP